MIFDEIVFHNFGIYQGRHVIPLSTHIGKPVLLIGALNGSGKTTCLEGLQLALYGNRSPFLSTVDGGYTTYLTDSINRFAPTKEGAAVEVAFKAEVDGTYAEYRVIRSWSRSGQKVNEHLQVAKYGLVDNYLSSSWIDHMEELLPSRVADLFFFDGERIESLADPLKSAAYLRTAIDALLGLDVIKNLEKDLLQVEKKKKTDAATPAQKKELAALDESFKKLLTRRESIELEVQEIERNQGEYRLKVAEAEAELQRNGGDLFKRKQELYQRRGELNVNMQRIAKSMDEYASGSLPLTMLRPLIAKVAESADASTDWKEDKKVADAVTSYRDQLIKLFKTEGETKALELIKSFKLEKNRVNKSQAAYLEFFSKIQPSLFKSESFLEQLGHQVDGVKTLLSEEEKAQSEMVVIDRSLAAVPDEAKIRSIMDDIQSGQIELMGLEGNLAAFHESLKNIAAELNLLEKQRAKLLEGELKDKDVTRLTEHSARVRKTLVHFQERLREKHVDRLQTFIEQSFASLMRKQSLITRVQINAATCELTLFTGDNIVLPAAQLSAGERQLLAVAILWALARASGRAIPMVIDTPLGRLDETHRNLLVQNYFPRASHQIILLSTDSEIAGVHYQNLKPFTTNEYTLQYDEERKSTVVLEGYLNESDAKRVA
jgi:DNA sulfur modification protein DndD